MHDGSVTRVKPAVLDGGVGRIGVVVVALHHDVAANGYLAEGLTVMRHLIAGVVNDAQLA